METRSPSLVVKAQPEQPLAERFLYAAAVLHIAGFLTDAERRKVHARMMKWKAAADSPPKERARR
mgnify:CR=1 FL=1